MKNNLWIIFSLLFLLILAACANDETADIKDVIHEFTIGDFADVSASVTSEELIVMENGHETTYDLPEDEFFISIAPFIAETHECEIHSLTSCQGELVEEEFAVYIENEDGEIIIDEKMTTFANGFIDLWLPRNQTYDVMIEQNGKIAESQISTFEGDPTCITTMQLKDL